MHIHASRHCCCRPASASHAHALPPPTIIVILYTSYAPTCDLRTLLSFVKGDIEARASVAPALPLQALYSSRLVLRAAIWRHSPPPSHRRGVLRLVGGVGEGARGRVLTVRQRRQALCRRGVSEPRGKGGGGGDVGGARPCTRRLRVCPPRPGRFPSGGGALLDADGGGPTELFVKVFLAVNELQLVEFKVIHGLLPQRCLLGRELLQGLYMLHVLCARLSILESLPQCVEVSQCGLYLRL
mmetsp:Transcript_20508/g.33674  ORF Transcript_20508/g.33674 Transcript_20508/m.33674 type:complete len:241 (-) Transcript_20508:1423-2145(-)